MGILQAINDFLGGQSNTAPVRTRIELQPLHNGMPPEPVPRSSANQISEDLWTLKAKFGSEATPSQKDLLGYLDRFSQAVAEMDQKISMGESLGRAVRLEHPDGKWSASVEPRRIENGMIEEPSGGIVIESYEVFLVTDLELAEVSEQGFADATRDLLGAFVEAGMIKGGPSILAYIPVLVAGLNNSTADGVDTAGFRDAMDSTLGYRWFSDLPFESEDPAARVYMRPADAYRDELNAALD